MTPLRRRMIEDMRIRNLSPHTQRAYVEQVSRFARHFGRPPELLGQDEIRSWQIYLVEERRLAASSISVAVAALRFVYTVTLKKPWIVEDDIPTSRQPKKLPVVPSPGRKSASIPGRGEQPQTSDDPDRVLRDGAAHFRGGFPEARRDRQPADGHSGGGGQRPEGRVEDWRAGLGRGVPTMPRFQPLHVARNVRVPRIMRAPIRFMPRLMGPILLGRLSARRVALDRR